MADFNHIMKLLRMGVFGVASLFAFIVIVLGGLVTSFTNSYSTGYYFTFAALGIATGLLTLLTLPAMLALSLLRKGVVTSMVVVDIAWTWFLWIMWLAVGGSSSGIFLIGCGQYSGGISGVQAACSESTGITALGFLTWIMLLFYNVTLISLAFRQHMRGNTGVWTKDITEVDFMAESANTTQVVYDNKVNPTFAPQYPPQMGSPGSIPQQPTPGSYTQPQAAYGQQAYGQPQTSPYAQPQAAGSFTQPQTNSSPYPQV
ncbi:hypothetical protein BYT27DRAFT_7182087 [Phlegmacium glaucopus]|nr:hypothetical protein BYT27DRAFT_7182087 [Phlegmacium glaucopus]